MYTTHKSTLKPTNQPMDAHTALTVAGLSLLLFYGVSKLLQFYGIGVEVYGSYLAFYVFLVVSTLVLPLSYPVRGKK